MAATAQNTNNTTMRSEGKLAHLEQPLIPIPLHVAPQADYDQFVQNYNMHSMGKIVVELHAMLKLYEKGISKKAETTAVLAIREGNGMRAADEAIRSFDLILPSGLIIVLDKCHFAPSITRDDSSYLWHCCLGLINKKRMDKLQHDGVLQPIHNESLEKCKSCIFGKMTQNQLDKKIKAIRSDHGGEYLSYEFVNQMKSCGIVSQLTPPYTAQHNGVFEMMNQTLLDMVRSMMNLTTLLKSFWGYALGSAVRILNMVLTKKVKRTPYKIWHVKAPKLFYVRV
uniref:Retrotransposon protein, putative, Ty1-copia subclass n=1 Tax=Tanacetum cinerariifolium TaxID=118510 RepID=A0A6L2N1R5_TANCI|nr:retrotransposon protein, putative, Ty1-copia subclass [Tanacetum cinerariifolium]